MSFGKFFVGVGLGALAGILLAPKKGGDLRDDLKDKANGTYDKVKGLTKEDVEATLNETVEDVKKYIDEFDSEEFKNSTKAKVEDLEKKLEELSQKVKTSQQFEHLADAIASIAGKLNTLLGDVTKKAEDQGVLPDEKVDEQIDQVEDELDDIISEFDDADDEENK